MFSSFLNGGRRLVVTPCPKFTPTYHICSSTTMVLTVQLCCSSTTMVVTMQLCCSSTTMVVTVQLCCTVSCRSRQTQCAGHWP